MVLAKTNTLQSALKAPEATKDFPTRRHSTIERITTSQENIPQSTSNRRFSAGGRSENTFDNNPKRRHSTSQRESDTAEESSKRRMSIVEEIKTETTTNIIQEVVPPSTPNPVRNRKSNKATARKNIWFYCPIKLCEKFYVERRYVKRHLKDFHKYEIDTAMELMNLVPMLGSNEHPSKSIA